MFKCFLISYSSVVVSSFKRAICRSRRCWRFPAPPDVQEIPEVRGGRVKKMGSTKRTICIEWNLLFQSSRKHSKLQHIVEYSKRFSIHWRSEWNHKECIGSGFDSEMGTRWSFAKIPWWFHFKPGLPIEWHHSACSWTIRGCVRHCGRDYRS